MNALMQEIIFLATSVRVWLLIALVLFLFFRHRLRDQTDEDSIKIRTSFNRPIKFLAWVNGIIFLLNFNAWIFSGPISGIEDILSDADLPGGTGVIPASLENVFDFSMDPMVK